MAFSIHQLDELDAFTEESEKKLDDYIDTLLEQFEAAPEFHALTTENWKPGRWSVRLINMGFTYAGATLPQMTVEDVDEIVNEVFPSKITLADPDDADEVIPELTAFWQFLKREYQLANADAVLAFLRKIEPEFKEQMNDPANFGIAKSFFTAGLDAGFDMTTPEGMEAFRQHYNANLPPSSAWRNNFPTPEGFSDWTPDSFKTPTSKVDKTKKKRLRQQAKAARKKNRRRK